ncbi:MAG TPA: magnesium/cobalt transporter CorA [Syntrophales bacterium]|nr:magnesium/cobalt transporter CorA [Syntrophales bacterium]HOX95007.1 magnesium/cobalt transporter CorA [Syntrophales bacterium]HPI57945.1 magnesium/cobalt transporter CorA [Syntrophales bacterium]HPN24576.1 magnesium/cobalt transporter CorA [Syntrophales bacterium]HQM28882.1 magnesium/cobalt transporter CorA [Syntrophales bacterium]
MPKKKDARTSRMAGLPPGTLVHIGERLVEKPKIRVMDYDESRVEEKELRSVDEAFPYKGKPTVTWISIDGIHDKDVIEKIGCHFNIHPLLLEDIMNTDQQPKLEDFGDYLFIVLKTLSSEGENGEIRAEQVSLVVNRDVVISFQERESPVFDSVRERIRSGKGRHRRSDTDYLAYSLIDAVVDHYFVIMEELGEEIETLEDRLVADPRPQTLKGIQRLRKKMLIFRKSVWPLREVILHLERSESSLVHKTTEIFFRDVYEHTIQVMDTIETHRDMLSGMLDIYLSSISNRLNEVMKVLTIIATIFIPLTFIAGVYGMNFEFLPEVKWRYGYAFAWAIMITVAAIMIYYFRKKKWI